MDAAVAFARQLLALGADPNLRSRWTNMRALHYAAYFDVPQLIQLVLQASHPGGEKMLFVEEEEEEEEEVVLHRNSSIFMFRQQYINCSK